MPEDDFIEKICKFSEIKNLLIENDVQIDSPDGFVGVSEYIDKGVWGEFVVRDIRGNEVHVNENHLFYTQRGWVLTKDIVHGDSILKDDGRYHLVAVECTGKKIPIVDIVVDSENHQYYANGFCSHNTNVGKTLSMIHFASSYVQQGKNVLYITLEMAEEEIARRVDANIFNIKINDVEHMEPEKFTKGINALKAKTCGKLIINQYPTGSGHVGHFRQLLQELWLKKNFKPDVIFVDYIGICASARVKLGATNSYFYVKAVAEELRGLGIEYECPVWTAVQATRGGFDNTDMDITDTAESFGLPATADLLFGVIRTEELDALGQLLIKQMKNRYGNKNYFEKFVIGVDAETQRLHDVEMSAQDNLGADASKDDAEDKEPKKRDRLAKKGKSGKAKKFDDFK